jgi:hypothetical protein
VGVTGYVGVALLLVAAGLGYLAFRRLRLLREGGIHVAWRDTPDDLRTGWHLGVGRFSGDEFTWYRVLSVRGGPDRTLSRDELEIENRREPSGPESYGMPLGATVLRCRNGAVELELAMASGALTGFLSWLESQPPGRSIPWAS